MTIPTGTRTTPQSPSSIFHPTIIVKKDGSTIVSKVLEITSTEVKYKKFTNLEGPTYVYGFPAKYKNQ